MEDLSGDGSLTKTVIRAAPEGAGHPPTGARVTVHYVGTLLDGTQFDSSRGRGQPFEFKLGVGQVISAWDLGVASMRQGELALIECKSNHGYGWEGSPPKIPKDASLRFEVELFGWVEKTIEDMSNAEKLAHAQEARTAGTASFKEQDIYEAREKFAEAIDHLVAMDGGASKEPEARAALLSCLLNAAQCDLKMSNWGSAADRCSKALALEPQSAKALFRRGVAYTELQRFAEAKADLVCACKLEPKSREIREQFERTKAAHAEARSAEKSAFGGVLK